MFRRRSPDEGLRSFLLTSTIYIQSPLTSREKNPVSILEKISFSVQCLNSKTKINPSNAFEMQTFIFSLQIFIRSFSGFRALTRYKFRFLSPHIRDQFFCGEILFLISRG